MLIALTFFVAGCATKPTPDDTSNGMTGNNAGQSSQGEVLQQKPSGLSEQDISEAEAAARAARAAEEAASTGLVRIHFEFDQYLLTPAAQKTLRNNAKLLSAAPAINVLIEGHCDERGSDGYNLALGEKRAMATKNYMVSLGVAASRLNIISYGEEIPLDPASTEEAWAKNRRAEFKVKR
ncbi:MAG: peptidoglycan-associated lipoprotein [Desulfuromonas sp.]|nr:MAG: peptidoglycan-associated lipoprotein [Desulfuromonas sp.]